MPVACSNCREAGLVCRVHVRSGRCNECNRANRKNCNIRVSADEWSVIKAEKDRLQSRLAELKREQLQIEEALRINAEKASEAIAVEEAAIVRLEQAEASSSGNGVLAMSPFSWSASDGFLDDIWEAPAPDYLGEPLPSGLGSSS